MLAGFSGTPANYVWDRESGLLLLVDDGTNAYLHEDGALAQINGAGTPEYLLDDALGSRRGVTDLAGMLTGAANYDAFGAVRTSAGTGSVFGYTGEQSDAETGYTYLRARYLNPTVGRFTSADSAQPNAPGTQGYNLYAYVANNPTAWVDPSGHEVKVNAAYLTGALLAGAFTMQGLMAICGQQAQAAGAGTPGSGLVFALCENAIFVSITVPILLCALSTEVVVEPNGMVTVVNKCMDWAQRFARWLAKTKPIPLPIPREDPPASDCSKVPFSPPLTEDRLNHVVAGHAKGVNVPGQSEFAWSDKETIRGIVNTGAKGAYGRWLPLGQLQCQAHVSFPDNIGTDTSGVDTRCLRIWVQSRAPYSVNTAFPVEDLACKGLD